MAHAPGDAHEEAIYGAHFRVVFPILDADGDLVSGAAGLDSEVSLDGGTFADCTNEATEIAASSGMYYLDLTGAEMAGKCVSVVVKTSTTGAKTTPLTIYPKRLKSIASGTAQAGAAGSITLAAGTIVKDGSLDGCYVLITNNSPAGAQYQLRRIIGSVASTQVATVDSNWGTNPGSASTYDLLAPLTANVAAWGGSALATIGTAGLPDTNLTRWLGGTPAALSSSRVPSVDPNSANLDAAVSTRATPAQVAAAVGTPLQAVDYTPPPSAASIAGAVWAASGRTLTSWGTLAADVAAAVWSFGTRSLTTFGTLVADLRAGISADHGSGAYGPGDAGGAFTATITVLDDDTEEPLPEVRVTVRTAAGVLKAQARTDDAGELAVPLDDGEFRVAASGLPGYSGTADQPLTVDGAAATLTVRLAPIPFAAAAPGTRVVRVITLDPSGAALAGVPVTAHLAARGRVSVDQALVVLQTLSVTSGEEGVADLVLITEDQFEEGDGVYVIRCGDLEAKTSIPAGSGALNLQEHLQG